jgi:hypothetical protein
MILVSLGAKPRKGKPSRARKQAVAGELSIVSADSRRSASSGMRASRATSRGSGTRPAAGRRGLTAPRPPLAHARGSDFVRERASCETMLACANQAGALRPPKPQPTRQSRARKGAGTCFLRPQAGVFSHPRASIRRQRSVGARQAVAAARRLKGVVYHLPDASLFASSPQPAGFRPRL